MDRLLFCIVVFTTLFFVGDCSSLTDIRIKILLQRVNRINNLLSGIKSGRFNCNTTMYTVSRKVDKVSELVQHLYKGPLLAKMDLSRGYSDKKNVLLHLPSAMEVCMKSYEGTPVSPEQSQITCLQQILWRYEVPTKARDIRRARSVVRSNSSNLFKIIPRPPRRVRREYRTLSQEEREDFHKAMNELFEDGTIAEYATLHRVASDGAHGGPAFLPWHRLFILSFENALREKNPNLTLPYWDSSLDDAMGSPLDSAMWTKKQIGRGSGIVGEPFPDWYTHLAPLEREYGMEGALVSKMNVDDMNTRCRFKEISEPLGEGKYRLERFHNAVHRWIGGAMSATGTAAYDPVFYLHHTYIDYLWEKWRKIQKECGYDTETDYVDVDDFPDTPYWNEKKALQCFNCKMSGMNQYNVSDGMLDKWTKYVFRYEDSPTCENNCGGSKLLYCHKIKKVCLPTRRFVSSDLVIALPLPGTGTSAPDPILKLRKSLEVKLLRENQNWHTGLSAFHCSRVTTYVTGSDFGPAHLRNLYGKDKRQCDKFLDPNCNNLRANLWEEADVPLQPWDELQTIEQMVPINRGELFPAEDRDSRSLWTMKEDIEEFDREFDRNISRFPTFKRLPSR